MRNSTQLAAETWSDGGALFRDGNGNADGYAGIGFGHNTEEWNGNWEESDPRCNREIQKVRAHRNHFPITLILLFALLSGLVQTVPTGSGQCQCQHPLGWSSQGSFLTGKNVQAELPGARANSHRLPMTLCPCIQTSADRSSRPSSILITGPTWGSMRRGPGFGPRQLCVAGMHQQGEGKKRTTPIIPRASEREP